jgi:hypothetical protein
MYDWSKELLLYRTLQPSLAACLVPAYGAHVLYLATLAGVDTVVLAACLVPAYGAHMLRIRQRVARRIVPAL